MLDFNILQQNFVFKLLLTVFSSRNKNVCDDVSKQLILSILHKAVGIKGKVVLDLVKRYGFLVWVLDQCHILADEIISKKSGLDEVGKMYEGLVDILTNSWNSVKDAFGNTNIASEERVTIMEYHYTTRDVVGLTLKIYNTRALSFTYFQRLVKLTVEVETIRNGLKSDISTNEVSLQRKSHAAAEDKVKDMCISLLADEKYCYQSSARNRKSIEDVQQEIEKVFKSSTI